MHIKMELRHLRYFCVAAEEMHIRRAAERLAMAQPPLTQQIKALESELGVKLFARAGRGITLTEAGRIFHAEARAILAHVERATALARQVATGYVGRLRVGFTPSASFSPVLTKVFTTFRSTWPGVELLLVENHTDGLTDALERGALEAAFVRPPLRANSTIVFEALASEPMMVAVPLGHPLARRESIALRDLADESFIAYPRRHGSGLSDSVIAECRRVGFAPRIAQETPQLSATINLVAAAMGIAIVPECMRHVRPESVAFVKLADSGLMAHLGLAYHRDERSKAVRNLVETTIAVRG
jgi:DNA-binding transcriptional LysR family regulator